MARIMENQGKVPYTLIYRLWNLITFPKYDLATQWTNQKKLMFLKNLKAIQKKLLATSFVYLLENLKIFIFDKTNEY